MAPPRDGDSDDLALAGRIDRLLVRDLTECWFPRVVDVAGGYVESFDHAWRPTGDTRRHLVCQARTAWAAAAFARYSAPHRASFAEHARHGLAFIDSQFYDARDDAFYFEVDRAGIPLRDGEQHTVAVCFALFAAGELYALDGDATARRVGERAFSWLQGQALDLRAGGYTEELARDGTPLGADRAPAAKNPLGAPYGHRTANVHLHVVEALEGWASAERGAGARDALSDAVDQFVARFVDPSGRLRVRADDAGAWETFGHALEAAHLLRSAADHLEDAPTARAAHAARALADHVLDHGRDARHGGTYESASRWRRAKIWWVQAEALAAWARFACEGSRAEEFRRALDEQWSFIERCCWDRVQGGWHWRVSRRGRPRRPSVKAAPWKSCYHTTRCQIVAVRSLRERAAGSCAARIYPATIS